LSIECQSLDGVGQEPFGAQVVVAAALRAGGGGHEQRERDRRSEAAEST
jgi:hypothetical protein